MANNKGYLTSSRINSELYTPYYAVTPIMKYLPRDKKIWCPFDPEWSSYYQTLKNNGFNVIRSCIQEGKDFFTYEPDNWDIIVSNPPFDLKDDIIKRLYELNKPFAILLPLNSLQGKSRYNYFSNGIQILAFDARIAFHNPLSMYSVNKGTPFASVYFCRNLLPSNLILEHLEIDDKPLRAENNYLAYNIMCSYI